MLSIYRAEIYQLTQNEVLEKQHPIFRFFSVFHPLITVYRVLGTTELERHVTCDDDSMYWLFDHTNHKNKKKHLAGNGVVIIFLNLTGAHLLEFCYS